MENLVLSNHPEITTVQELSVVEIDEVSGGVGFLVIMAAITVTATAAMAVEQIGEKIGKALYSATH